MRPQQITRLTELEEQLIDLFSEECKPDEWRAAKAGYSRDEALKQKKVALATMQLVGRVQNTLRDVGRSGAGDDPGERARQVAQPAAPDLKRVSPKLRKEAEALLKQHEKIH